LKGKNCKYLLLALGLVLALRLPPTAVLAIAPSSAGSIGGTITCAETGEGIEGVIVTLTDSADGVAVTNTDVDGVYLFIELIAGGYTVTVNTGTLPENCNVLDTELDDNDSNSSSVSLGQDEAKLDEDFSYVASTQPSLGRIGDQVWCDENENGTLDADEGIANVSVIMVNADGASITATTNEQGVYLFENLVDGSYAVSVDISSLPTECNVPSTGPDGELNIITVILSEGENNLEQDFSYSPTPATALASVGNYIWLDQNTNGIQDASEVNGVAGITIQLYDAATDTILLQTTTNSSGLYLFGDLQPGDYFIRYELPDLYQLSPQHAGSNEQQDSNADPMSGRTETFTLTAGLSNLTVDQGVYLPTVLTVIAEPKLIRDIVVEPQISYALLLPLMHTQ